MATLYAKSQARSQAAFLNEWQGFTRPALVAMVQAGLDLVSAMDTYRGGRLATVDTDRHDASAVDHIAGLLDHLSDEHGAALRAGDAVGVPADLIELDVSELEAAYVALKQRAIGPPRAKPTSVCTHFEVEGGRSRRALRHAWSTARAARAAPAADATVTSVVKMTFFMLRLPRALLAATCNGRQR